MSYDRIWLCPSLKREDWIEVRSKSRKLTSNSETFTEEAIERELQKYGEFEVSIAMGENCLIDELYSFLQEADARRFYAGGPLGPDEQSYLDRECADENSHPFGFDRVELYIHDKLVERHQGIPPSKSRAEQELMLPKRTKTRAGAKVHLQDLTLGRVHRIQRHLHADIRRRGKSHIELRDFSTRQRKALENFVASIEDADSEIEFGDELDSTEKDNE